LEQIHHTQHKRPAEPLSAQPNKRLKIHEQLQLPRKRRTQLEIKEALSVKIDPRGQLLKECRIWLGINRAELCRRVNTHLKKILSNKNPLISSTLLRIEENKALKETIDAYYNAINTVLAEAPEARSQQK
jgi:hypothetical protein